MKEVIIETIIDSIKLLPFLLITFLLIELEIVLCVVVRNVFHHLAQQLAIVGQQALLHIVAQQVAEDATEVLMARIAQERA